MTHYWQRIDTLIVHCHAGLSCSPAVAASIARLKWGENGEFFADPFLPSNLVYRTILELAAGREDYCAN